ncbi:MAG: DinB family protein [Cytophagales bacterium]
MLKKSSKLIKLLKNEKNDIDSLLQYVPLEKFNRKISANEWSIAQVVSHIYLAESQTLDAIKWRVENKTAFPTPPLSSYFRVFYAVLLFKLKIKMKAPSFVTPSEAFVNKDELLENWQQTRRDWSEFVYTFPNKLEGRVVYKHPIMGYLSLALALTFMYHHLLRHKSQIIKLIDTQYPTSN